MRTDRLERLGVIDFQRTGHRPFRLIRMRQVDFSLHHHRAVEMLDGAVLVALPLLHELAGFLFVFGDGLVIDRIEVLRIHADALVRLGNVEFPNLLERRLRAGFRDNTENKQCRKYDGRPVVHALLLVTTTILIPPLYITSGTSIPSGGGPVAAAGPSGKPKALKN